METALIMHAQIHISHFLICYCSYEIKWFHSNSYLDVHGTKKWITIIVISIQENQLCLINVIPI